MASHLQGQQPLPSPPSYSHEPMSGSCSVQGPNTTALWYCGRRSLLTFSPASSRLLPVPDQDRSLLLGQPCRPVASLVIVDDLQFIGVVTAPPLPPQPAPAHHPQRAAYLLQGDLRIALPQPVGVVGYEAHGYQTQTPVPHQRR